MTVMVADCIEHMRSMDEHSVDAVVCDPPYGIDFMGKAWDRYSAREFEDWCASWAVEALRALKPGGHLLAFGGTRTYHRLAAGIEDAGFEIRDCLAWMYGSGFPKSLDVSKAIDKAAGAEREVIGEGSRHALKPGPSTFVGNVEERGVSLVTAPATAGAAQWQGWGTALKPAWESVVVARKPLVGTVAANVLLHGTGALNIDGCRIGTDGGTRKGSFPNQASVAAYGDGLNGACDIEEIGKGRWPANVVLDEEAAGLLDEQTGELSSGANPTRRGSDKLRDAYGDFKGQEECAPARGADSGGGSRFFYVAKAGSRERSLGLPDGERSTHPTVKPVELMRWLIRLVTPPGGTVLDPFTGSGTTGVAAHLEGVEFLGIEREPEYAEIARARIEWWRANTGVGARTDAVLKVDRDPAQLDLLGGEAA